MKKKFFAILTALVLAVGLCAPTVLAETKYDYKTIDYSTVLTVGAPATGTVLTVDETYVSVPYYWDDWVGYAKGFSVTLEEGNYYTFTAQTDGADGHQLNLFLLNDTLTGDYDQWNGDLVACPDEGVFAEDTATNSMDATCFQTGTYKLLLVNFAYAGNGEDEYPPAGQYDYTVTVEKAERTAVTVDSAEELLALDKGLICYTVDITADIDLSGKDWAPIDLNGCEIRGNGHKITGLNSSLFGTVQDSIIRDLTVSGDMEDKDTELRDIALLASYVTSSKVTNCHATGTIDLTATQTLNTVGGLIANLDESTVTDTTADVDIVIHHEPDTKAEIRYIGSLFGDLDDNNTVTGCVAKGDITLHVTDHTDDERTYAELDNIGGFAGDTDDYCRFTDCRAYGNITVNGDPVDEDDFGGLIGDVGSYNVFTDCYAYGDVLSGDADDAVGGFAGCQSDGNRYVNCGAYGDVKGDEDVGGFLGKTSSDYENDGDENAFINCFALGQIDLTDENGGGFIGYIGSNDLFLNCYSASAMPEEDNKVGAFGGDGYSKGDPCIFENSYANGADDTPLLNNADDTVVYNKDKYGITAIDMDDETEVNAMIDSLNAYVEKYNELDNNHLRHWVLAKDATLPTHAYEVTFIALDGTQAAVIYAYEGQDVTALVPAGDWETVDLTDITADVTVKAVKKETPAAGETDKNENPATGDGNVLWLLPGLAVIGIIPVLRKKKES